MHNVSESLSPASTSRHRQSDPSSHELIESVLQQLKAQKACINAEAEAMQAQARRLHPAVRHCEHSLTAKPWFSAAAALLAILVGAVVTLLARLAL